MRNRIIIYNVLTLGLYSLLSIWYKPLRLTLVDRYLTVQFLRSFFGALILFTIMILLLTFMLEGLQYLEHLGKSTNNNLLTMKNQSN